MGARPILKEQTHKLMLEDVFFFSAGAFHSSSRSHSGQCHDLQLELGAGY